MARTDVEVDCNGNEIGIHSSKKSSSQSNGEINNKLVSLVSYPLNWASMNGELSTVRNPRTPDGDSRDGSATRLKRSRSRKSKRRSSERRSPKRARSSSYVEESQPNKLKKARRERSQSAKRSVSNERAKSRSPRRHKSSRKSHKSKSHRRSSSPKRSDSLRRSRSASLRRSVSSRRSNSSRRRSLTSRRRSNSSRRRSVSPKRRPISPRRRRSTSARRSISPERSPRRSWRSPRRDEAMNRNYTCDPLPESRCRLFEELNISRPILEGIAAMNIFELNRFQKIVLPMLLDSPNNSFYFQAKPSFGKKITYLINVMQYIDPNLNEPQALIVVPSPDLGLRLQRIARSIAEYTNIKVKLIIADFEPYSSPTKEQLVICTSGTLHHHLNKYGLFDMKKLKTVVYDEFPILSATSKNQYYVRELLAMKSDCQLIFFSANFDSDYEMRFIKRFIDKITCINLLERDESLSNIRQLYSYCRDMHEKNVSLRKIFKDTRSDKSLVFVSDRRGASRVADNLRNHGYRSFLLNSDLNVEDRFKEIRQFETSRQAILVLTYPLSVGLDLSKVTLVVNYDLPYDCENFFSEYFYRIEECTRTRSIGTVINLVDSLSRNQLTTIEEYYGFRCSRLSL